MNNKRNINRFDPFIPVNMSEVGKRKLNENGNVNFESENLVNNAFNFVTIDDKFKLEMPCVKKGFVILLTRKEIGVGNILGEKLLENFILSLSDSVELPQHIIIMNEAVHLLDNKNVYPCILKMQKYGVDFLVSSESMEYFKCISKIKGIKQATSADISEKIIFSEKLISI